MLARMYRQENLAKNMPVIPAFWVSKEAGSLGQFKTSLANMMTPHLYQKYKN